MAKIGLCIGINEYGGGNLDGAVNDAKDWAKALRARGFTVEPLHDEDATRERIVAKMKSAIAEAGSGDRLVFTFSGHGAWATDENEDEEDGRDEGICPCDVAEKGPILDDEMFTIFEEVKDNVRLVFLVDACSAGDVAARMPGPGERKKRFLPPEKFLKGEALRRAREVTNLPSKGRSRLSKALLISSCKDGDEDSSEIFVDDRPTGAFTHVALDLLAQSDSAPTYGDWHAKMRAALVALGLDPPLMQEPQISGSDTQKNWKVFV